jgi:hypothetical protein
MPRWPVHLVQRVRAAAADVTLDEHQVTRQTGMAAGGDQRGVRAHRLTDQRDRTGSAGRLDDSGDIVSECLAAEVGGAACAAPVGALVQADRHAGAC